MTLKEYRAEQGISQREFAKLCGLSLRFITALEGGDRYAKAVTAQKISDVTGGKVSVLSLMKLPRELQKGAA